MDKYFGCWSDRDGLVKDFFSDYNRKIEVPEDFPTDDEILYACYEAADYEGHALVIYEKDGKLYEVNGGHCSCYGLEDQWSPEETSWAALKMRRWNGYDGSTDELKALIERSV